MICGQEQCFFPESKCFLGKMSAMDLSDESCVIKQYVTEKQRWEVQLMHPRFNGRHVLVNDSKLIFDYFVAPPDLFSFSPEHIFVADTGACGKGLYCSKNVDRGGVVFEEKPFMVVRNDGDAFMSRWNLYCRALREHGPHSPIIHAFNELADGGVVDEYVTCAAKMVQELSQNSRGTDMPNTNVDKIFGKIGVIAIVLARWQTNGDSFRPTGREGQSAIWRFASKMNHSCEANCTREVSRESGCVVVRAARDIHRGDPLTSDYMGGDAAFHGLPVEGRRQRLKARGFTCACSRCARESEEQAST
eukprot:gnl/TRDRNA2_/TRDRNA2_202956_c0_seq1.p1 gnl/TRDRNA2_/TRDRNA2_202956_c0~~gnl/TRDRNA2_/TRDRNA2_202956_c0_seq1.p1  ORF type:complete len:304 (+),score=28.18 gnl/TRDRNA2_/TRDRNA2_202956_c0_seq1:123-1034(+)